MKVIVSCCHAGQNPSPGLGLARSLREAYPDAWIVGKDHAALSTGLHHPVFDEVWVARPWPDLDLDLHREELLDRLGPDGLLLSGLDVEVAWLARSPDPRVLVPPAAALEGARKPSFPGASGLPGVRIPAHVPLDRTPAEVLAFCRRHGLPVWVKGRTHEARRARDWRELREGAEHVARTWSEGTPFVQEHVEGWEVCIAFAAHSGELLEAVFLEKRFVTDQGKTWAGAVSPLRGPLREALAETCRALAWTGGGELEFVRDAAGVLWLIDWNPRFPAWCHGATIAGYNLVAALVAGATGREPARALRRAPEFVRVVLEVPVRSSLPLPPPPPTLAAHGPALGKHPTGTDYLARRLRSASTDPAPGSLPAAPLAADLSEVCAGAGATPARRLLRRTLSWQLDALAERVAALRDPRVRVAYSIKTNPDPELLATVLGRGHLAEAISAEEVQHALDAGFASSAIVHNGPVPLPSSVTPIRAVFADSLHALARYVEAPPAKLVGVRLRPPGVTSRFGVEVEDPAAFEDLARSLERASGPIGVSMHLASGRIGLPRWSAAALATVELAGALAAVSGRPVGLLDLGGGWEPEDGVAFMGAVEATLARARQSLPHLEEVLLEPGRALVQPCGALLCRVVEVRRRVDTAEVVVDGSLAELPLAGQYPHRVFAWRADALVPLGVGRDRVLGRLCMEDDIVADGVAIPPWLSDGDLLCVADAGAYDTSMSFRFGKGQ